MIQRTLAEVFTVNAAFVKAHTAARVEAAWRHILTPAKSGSLRSLDGGLRFELRGLQQTPLNWFRFAHPAEAFWPQGV